MRPRSNAFEPQKDFVVGDRIQVVGIMRNDPDPIPVGTTGTVTYLANEGTVLEQVHVDWDVSPDGRKRTLMLVPADYSIVVRIAPHGERGST